MPTTVTVNEATPSVRREDYYYPGSLWVGKVGSESYIYVLVKTKEGFAALRFDKNYTNTLNGFHPIPEAATSCLEPFHGSLTITCKEGGAK